MSPRDISNRSIEPDVRLRSHDLPTIAAISTGTARAGVAVVRVSGSQVRFVLETIAGGIPAPRIASLRRLRDRAGETIDSALVLFFPAPFSFTGDDVAELQVHGSPAVLKRLIAVLTAFDDVRLAEPGEFTRRAFLAGKMDIAAVEGLADLIDSETEWQRRQALLQSEGALGTAASRWRTDLTDALALLDADLDFSDEADVDSAVAERAAALLVCVRGSLTAALDGFRSGERVREGAVVVLAGPPNAGKSSLLNALVRREAAIVSAIPGTTRDPVEVRLDLDGMPVTLIDTAGLRDSVDPIEREGIARTWRLIDRADLVVSLRAIDSDPVQIAPTGAAIAVASKADLAGPRRAGELAVSAATGEGLDELMGAIANRLASGVSFEPALLTRERHRVAVEGAATHLDTASAMLAHPELAAEDVRLAIRALERLIGKVDQEEVLDRLFAGFCIGK